MKKELKSKKFNFIPVNKPIYKRFRLLNKLFGYQGPDS